MILNYFDISCRLLSYLWMEDGVDGRRNPVELMRVRQNIGLEAKNVYRRINVIISGYLWEIMRKSYGKAIKKRFSR